MRAERGLASPTQLMKAIAHRASFKRNFFIPAECVAAWFINTLWAITLLSNLNSYLISGTKNLTSSVLPVKMCLKAVCLSRRVESDSWATSTGSGTKRWPFPPSSSVDLCALSSLRLMLFEWPACWLQEIFDVLDVFWLTNVKETTCHPVPRWCRCYVERKPDRTAYYLFLKFYFKLSCSTFKKISQFFWSLSWFCTPCLKCVCSSLSYTRYSIVSLSLTKLNLPISTKLGRGTADLTTERCSWFKYPSPSLYSFLLLWEEASGNFSLHLKTQELMVRLSTAQI